MIDLTEVDTGDMMAEIARRDWERSHAEALTILVGWVQNKTLLHFTFGPPNVSEEEPWMEYIAMEKSSTPGLRDKPFMFILVSFQDDFLILAPVSDRPEYQNQNAIRVCVGDNLQASHYSDAQVSFDFAGHSIHLWPWSEYERFKKINEEFANMTDEEAEQLEDE